MTKVYYILYETHSGYKTMYIEVSKMKTKKEEELEVINSLINYVRGCNEETLIKILNLKEFKQ